MASLFAKGTKVVKLLSGARFEVAALGLVVAEDLPGQVESLLYDAETGREIDPVIPGFSSRIVRVDGQ